VSKYYFVKSRITRTRCRTDHFFVLWPWTMAYDLDLRSWPISCQVEPASQNL